MRASLVFIILSAQYVAITQAIDCYLTTGTALDLCDRWIACRDSAGTQCDGGSGNLGTVL